MSLCQVFTLGHSCKGACICTKQRRYPYGVAVHPACPVSGHTRAVTQLQFSDDGAQVISGSAVIGFGAAETLALEPFCLTDDVRFWDVASGTLVRQIASCKFAFVESREECHTAKTGRHILKAVDGGTLLCIYELVGEEVGKVATFQPPSAVCWVQCHGAAICVGCSGGAVCMLSAPFLAT